MQIDMRSKRVYVRIGATDMRKAINGLSAIVQGEMKKELFSESVYVFCNRRRDIAKILYWDRNGFCLWEKRLEKDRFVWPGSEEEVMEIDSERLGWLVNGLDIMKAHERLKYRWVV